MKKITLDEIPPPPTDPVKLYFWGGNAFITWPFLGLIMLLAYKHLTWLLTWLSATFGQITIVDLLADLWAIPLAFALSSFLLALPLSARAYELTVGSAYRARDRVLQGVAARAQAEALDEAEQAMAQREKDLEKREREYEEKHAKFRQEQTDQHLRNLEIMESRAQQQDQSIKGSQASKCSGKRRRLKGIRSNESVFDIIP